tara:strand:- start:17112 stop:18839 length:1728 start_codon:yes stop_codon:yes gene_type:complete
MIKKILRFVSLLDNRTKKNFLILIFFVFLGSIVEIFSFSSILPLIDLTINDQNSYLSNYDFIRKFVSSFENKLELLLYLTIFISMLFILKNLYLIFLTWFNAKFTNSVRIFFSSIYLNQILINPYSYHLKNDSSKIIRDNFAEVTTVTKHILFPTILTTLDLLTFFGLVAVLAFTNFKASILIFITISLFSIFYTKTFKAKLKMFGDIRLENDKKKIKIIIESLKLIKIVSIKNLEEFILKRYEKADYKTVKSSVFNSVILNSIRFILEILMLIVFLALIFFASINNYNINDLFTYLIFLSIFFVRILPSVNKFLVLLNNYNYYGKSLDNIYNDIQKFGFNKKNSQNKIFLKNNDFRETIKLNNASFAFENNKVFEKINLEIKKNKITVISGGNGAGKSTLINILLGLLPLKSGEYSIDNKKISISDFNLSRLIGYMPQEINLIDDNIENNIALGKKKDEIDKNSIFEIAKFLKFDDFLNDRLNDKNFMVGENGINLSGGQKQKIVLARTFYGNPEIIILDEPTSALDEENTELFFKIIENLKDTKTFIIITHDQKIKSLSNKSYFIKNNNLQEE